MTLEQIFMLELAQIEAESICWIQLKECIYLRVFSSGALNQLDGIANAAIASLTAL